VFSALLLHWSSSNRGGEKVSGEEVSRNARIFCAS